MELLYNYKYIKAIQLIILLYYLKRNNVMHVKDFICFIILYQGYKTKNYYYYAVNNIAL